MFQSWQGSRISWAAQRFYRFEFWSLELWLDLNVGLQHWWWMSGSHDVLLGCWLLTGVVTCLVRRAGQLIFVPSVQGKGQFPSDASGCEHLRLTIRFNFHDLMPTCQVTQEFLQMWSPIVCGCMETGSPSCKWSKFLAPRFYCRPCLFNFWSFRTLTPGILISNIFIVGAFHIPLVTFLSLLLVL